MSSKQENDTGEVDHQKNTVHHDATGVATTEPVASDMLALAKNDASNLDDSDHSDDHENQSDHVAGDVVSDRLMNKVLDIMSQMDREEDEKSDEEDRRRVQRFEEQILQFNQMTLHLPRLDKTLPAVFFGEDGERLIPISHEIEYGQSLKLRVDSLGPQFVLRVAGPEVSDEILGKNFHDQSALTVHPQALFKMFYLDMTKDIGKDNKTSVPISVQDHAKQRLESGAHPVYVSMMFDVYNAGKLRTHMGTPPWAQDWSKAVKSGNLGMVLDGDAHTIQQIKTMEEAFIDYKVKVNMPRY